MNYLEKGLIVSAKNNSHNIAVNKELMPVIELKGEEKMKTILVVDDEPDVRDTVKMVLEKRGYRVITAVDGDDCLKILHKENPDLILLDIMMPGTPVKNVVEQIKNSKIAFLSVVRISEAEKCDLLKQKNIVDFIQKPFDVNDLIKRIEAVLNE